MNCEGMFLFSLLNNLIYSFSKNFFNNYHITEQVLSRRVFCQILMVESKNYYYRCVRDIWDRSGI